MRIEFFKIPKKGAKAKKTTGNGKKMSFRDPQIAIGGHLHEILSIYCKNKFRNGFLIPKNIVVHSKHIKFDEKMTKIEDSRISKMAAAAILNISFLPQLRKNVLVRHCSPKGP